MKPIEYNITPAKGQALLNFQGRRLPDKITLFETVVKEEIRASQNGQQKIKTDEIDINADFTNKLIHGDVLSACAYLKSQNIKVDLVYIDPPFASGANYAKKIYLRNNDKTEFENNNAIGEEVMYGDIWQKEDYLNWLYERLLAIKEVMSETASIYVHLDWHIGHYAKLLLDEIFGEENLVNEIVWHYTGNSVPVKSFQKKHDTILFYSKSEEYTLNIDEVLEEYSESTIRRYNHTDKNGRKYKISALISGKQEIVYAKEGKLSDDVWEIPVVRQIKEIVNYSTQKPEALLERIIKASSDKNMIIADFFSGSGTTLKVANDLGRKFIGCDIGINAIQTTRDRLVKAGVDFDILKVQDGIRLFRNPAQTQAKIFSLIDCFTSNTELELSEFWDGGIMSKKGTYIPVKFTGMDKQLTKNQVDFIIQQVISLEDKEQEEIKIDDDWQNKIPACKIIYAYKDIDIDQTYINKAVRDAKKTSIKVEILSLDELLDQKADLLLGEDTADIEITKENGRFKVEIKKYFSSYLKNKLDDFNAKKKLTVRKKIAEQLSIDEIENEQITKQLREEKTYKPFELSETGLELIESIQFDTTLVKNKWTSNLNFEDKADVKSKVKGVYYLQTDKFIIKIRNIAGDEIVINSEKLNK